MVKQVSNTDRVYERLRDMAISFEFKPEERINESALTTDLKVSRTPLREALNRLAAEGFLTAVPRQGFFCRPLSPERVQDLYQVRCALETDAVRRGTQLASDEAIQKLIRHLDETEASYSVCTDVTELLQMDEAFHLRLVGLAGNSEFLSLLNNVNARLRYVRMVNLHRLMEQGRLGHGEQVSLSMHRKIAEAVRDRQPEAAVAALRDHIERRSEETVELVRLAYSRLYVPA